MKKLWRRFDISLLAFVAAVVCISITVFRDWRLAIGEGGVLVLLVALRLLYQKMVKEKLVYRAQTVSEALDFEKGKAFSELTIPCALVDADGEVLWFNDAFRNDLSITEKTPLHNLKTLLRREKIDKLLDGRGFKIRVGERYFAVYSNRISDDAVTDYLLYFFDETGLRLIEREYYDTRPSILLAVIDNADEVYQDFKESECTAIFSMLEQMIDDWVVGFGGFCRKISSGRMLMIAEERTLRQMIADKFSILDRVRSFTYEGKQTDVTLSVGVGSEDTFLESNNVARQALDMAQSRGGDQVAIRKDAQYQFYGGVSAGFERKNKAKTRLIAKTIAELIRDSGNVLIMGHRFSDYDAIGSAIGLYAIAAHFGKRVNIVVDRATTLSLPLCEQYDPHGKQGVFVSPEKANFLLSDSTLLFVVDTHKKDFTEAPALLERAKKVIVIDHHRKSVGFIENAVVFYHSPTASSASEMVTELAQYIDKKPVLDAKAASALFAGIMLDTRNFIIRTGVRTFEAAAYLRSRAANTVEAKKLFAIDMAIFRERNSIIDAAQRYREIFAISVTEKQTDNQRLITSQAADEMLNIEKIKASFVVFRLGSAINVSARSYGEVNVQLIMEALGGGGHQTMAACQLGEIQMEEALEKLHAAIRQCTDK